MPAQTILITGASSGLGAALARAYAAPGRRLVLSGRDADRLAATAAVCRAQGAAAVEWPYDLRQTDALADALWRVDAGTPIDLAILNAGLGGFAGPDRHVEPVERAHAVASVNFTATVIAATALAERMAARGRGHIAIVGSIAESFPLPMAPTYAASKAGLRLFAEALDLRLAPRGVRVSLISPGFIETPMSRGLPFPKPFVMDVERAAQTLVRRLERRPRRIVIPWPFAVLRACAAVLPRGAVRAVLKRF